MEANGTLLIVDEKREGFLTLEQMLRLKGLTVYTTEFGYEALRILADYSIDIVIIDIHTAQITDLNLISSLKKNYPNIFIMITSTLQDIQIARRLFRLDAYDFLTTPFDPVDVWVSVSRTLEYRRLLIKEQQYRIDLEREVSNKTQALRTAIIQLEDALSENRRAHLETTIVLVKIAETNNHDTGNHLKRVSCYCEHLSRAMQLSEKMVDLITYSSIMHDIGKILISPSILNKSEQLSPQEYEIMKLHTIYGARILEDVPFLETARDIALYHHENFDGTGYPYRLKGEAIPLPARLVSLCDVFDALIASRCYKKSYSLDTATTILKSEVGRRFDPEIAESFFKIKDLMYQIYTEFQDESPNEPINMLPQP